MLKRIIRECDVTSRILLHVNRQDLICLEDGIRKIRNSEYSAINGDDTIVI
jgi:hypothetical protein